MAASPGVGSQHADWRHGRRRGNIGARLSAASHVRRAAAPRNVVRAPHGRKPKRAWIVDTIAKPGTSFVFRSSVDASALSL